MQHFVVAVLSAIFVFWPYLKKPSKYLRYSKKDDISSLIRPYSHELMVSSFVYLLAGALSAYLNQKHMAFLCATTCVTSLLYHRFREGRYFNIDNIFASALMFVFLISMAQSYGTNELYFMFGVLGIPVAAFLIVYCGMPADISVVSPWCCVRTDRPLYDLWHTYWHLASGSGLFVTAWFYSQTAAAAATSGASTVSMDLSFLSLDGSSSSSKDTYVYSPSEAYNQNISHLDSLPFLPLNSLLCPFEGESVMGSSCYIDQYFIFPIVPVVALCGGILVNLLGNMSGVMPID